MTLKALFQRGSSVAVIVILAFLAPWATAQNVNEGPNSSIYQESDSPEVLPPPLTIANGSPIRSVPITPRQIKLHDIISIRIDELARMQAEGEVERRKNASINAVMLNWLTLNGFGQAEQDTDAKRIQGQLDELYRAENGLESTERLTFNIAAEVVDIRPNGNIILEARKEIQTNSEVWRAALTGICRPEDVGLDNVVLSRNIVDLRITKHQAGHVNDATRRGWLLKIYDKLHPF